MRYLRPPVDRIADSVERGRPEALGASADQGKASASRAAATTAAYGRELRRGYDYLSRIGEQYLLSSVAGLLAEAMVAQGRLQEAEALSLEVEGIAAEDDADTQTLWRLARAKVLASRRDARAARPGRQRQ